MISMPMNSTPGMEDRVWALFIETSHVAQPMSAATGGMVDIGLPGAGYRRLASAHALPDENA